MDSQNRICWVCFPRREGLEPMQGELAAARRRLFADPKRTVTVDAAQNIKGFSGHVRGKLSRRHFNWKKKITGTPAGEVVIEESFGRKDGWALVSRDMYGVTVSRAFFDKQHQWQRTEYYEPWDQSRARVSFAAGSEPGTVLRSDWDPEASRYNETTLHQVPYRSGTAEQSVVDAQFGEPQLLLSLCEGEACCCPREEADQRLAAMKNVSSGTVVLMPAWEIKGGELIKEGGEGADITFTSLEEYAKIEPPQPGKPRPALTGETLPSPEPPSPTLPAPQQPSPPQGEDFAPEKVEPVAELPLIEPHEARHMRGSVNFEELIDAPVEPPVREAPPVQPQAPLPVPQRPLEPVPAPAPMPERAPERLPEQPPVRPEGPAPMPAPQPAQPAPQPAAPSAPSGELTYERAAHARVVPGPSVQEPAHEDDLSLESILAEAALYTKTPDLPEPSQETAGGMSIPDGYTGDIKDGRITGRGRTEQRGGLTSYEGDYVDGKRHGFGTYYYKDGNLCYAGTWKDDRRDGLGVSFRDSDHALHVANWREGQPHGLVTLFDSDGNMRYSGRMENGKKEGAGVVINGEDGTVFVGQWSGGEATGLGSAFDKDGRLLYYGSWKDGKRHGHGTEFDLNGGVVFDGEFRDGKYFNGVLYQKL